MTVGRLLMGIGLFIVMTGGILWGLGRLGFSRFPGNFVLNRGPLTVYVPLAASLAASLVLTLLANLIWGFIGRR